MEKPKVIVVGGGSIAAQLLTPGLIGSNTIIIFQDIEIDAGTDMRPLDIEVGLPYEPRNYLYPYQRDLLTDLASLRRSRHLQFKEPKELFEDDLPQNTTKPAFLMRQDHHIRKVRR